MPPANSVQIVLSVDKASYTAGLADASKQLDVLSGKAQSAGRSTVGSMQAASASIRALENPLNMNIRTLARFAASSETAGKIFQAAFPVVGAIAAIAMIAKLGTEIASFVKKVEQMPKAITAGFAQLDLSQKTSIDAMNVLTDKMNDAHAVFEHKPTNGLKTGIDEAKESADRFAESVIAANSRVNELLSKNHLSGWAILMGRQGTGGVEDAQKEYTKNQDHNAYLYATAAPGSPEQAAAKKAMDTTRSGYLRDRQTELANLNKNNEKHVYDSPIAANEGIIADISREQESDKSVDANEVAKKQAAVDEAKKKAAESSAAQDKKRLDAMKEVLDAEKLQNNLSIKQQFDYWSQKTSAFTKGSVAYNDVVKMQSALAVEGAVKAHEELLKAAREQKKNEVGDSTTGLDVMNNYARASQGNARKAGQDQTQDYVDSNKLALDAAQNKAKFDEAEITDKAGKSITKYAAAVQLAQIHAQEWAQVELALTGILNARKQAAANNPDSKDDAKAYTEAQIALANAQREHSVQMQSDSDNIYGKNSTGSTGFVDALNEFVNASKDAAGQMRELTDGTLKTLNQQFVMAMSGQRTDFSNMGAGIFRNVAGMGLQKAEGSILGGLGFGGKADGSSEKPFYVKMADKTQNAVSGIGGLFSKMFGGGSKGSGASGLASLMNNVGEAQSDDAAGGGIGTIASVLTNVIPFLASGGPIDGPAIVGENGPELYVPNSSGSIVPNHKLSSMGANSTTIAIDARGAGDPAQVQVAINKAIMAAAPHIMQGAVHLGRNMSQRKPTSSPR